MKLPSISIQKEQPGIFRQISPLPLLRISRGSRARNDQGATLIEALVTMVLMSILVIAVSPPIILSVAARVRARQVEIATQTAQNYIDGLTSGTLPPPIQYVYATGTAFPTSNVTGMQYVNAANMLISAGTFRNFIAPTGMPSDPGTQVDGNGNGRFNDPQDFRIQAIRTIVQDPPERTIADPVQRLARVQEAGYSLIVRVYRGDADMAIPLGTREIRTVFTSNNGKGTGFRNQPLVEIRTNIRGRRVNLGTLRNQTTCLWPQTANPALPPCP